MAKIDGHSLDKILSIAYSIPMGDPFDPACIWGAVPSIEGPPGTGKTARVKQSGKRHGVPVGILELGGRQPEDASGAPFLNKNDEVIIACLLGVVNDLNKAGRGVLCLDEINWARPNTQGAFLSMVNDRRVGDTIFSNHIRIILCSNPPKSAGGGYPLVPPMANRCLHFEVGAPSEEEENSYLMGLIKAQGKTIGLEELETRVINRWEDVWPTLVRDLIGFKRKFGDYVLKEPAPGDPKHHKAWPSPRSREMAIRAMTTIRILETTKDVNGNDVISPLEDLFMEAACGSEMATDWAAYRLESDLPDPLDMLTKGWKFDKRRLDRTLAAFSGVTAFILGRKDKKDKIDFLGPVFDLFPPLLENGLGDIAWATAQPLIRGGVNMDLAGPGVATYTKVMGLFAKKGYGDFIVE